MIAEDTIDVLVRWHAAHKAAEDNPKKLLAARTAEDSTRVSDECAALMESLGEAEAALFKLKELPADEVPPLLTLFLGREADKGCPSCWVSSRIQKSHPECQFKISEWFGYREALLLYVYHVYILHKPRRG